MYYQESLPAAPLRPYIKTYAILIEDRQIEGEVSERVPPFLSKAIVLSCRQNSPIFITNGTYDDNLPPGYILPHGLKSNLWTYTGQFAHFAIIFRPGQFRHFYRAPMFEFLGSLIDIRDFEEKSLLELHEKIVEAKSMKEQVKHADRFMLDRLRRVKIKRDIMDQALKEIFQDPCLPIHQIQRRLPVSQRHFRRLFSREIGITPKQYQKQLRFLKSMHLLENRQFQKLGDVAYQCGYYDQSDFIEQFKSVMQVTPKQYLQQLFPITQSIYWRE